MKFEIDKQKDKTIFKLESKTLDHEISAQLKAELIFLQKEIDNQFIIDLKDVIKCDSSGLSVLLLSERIERDKKEKTDTSECECKCKGPDEDRETRQSV